MRRHGVDQALGDLDRAGLVEGPVIAERGQEQLERLALDDAILRHIVDHQMGEIRLAGDRAEAGEFRRGEADDEIRAGMPARHSFQHRLFRALRQVDLRAEL